MKDLSEGKPSKLIFQFAGPMLLGNVFQQLYNVVDSIVVGNFIGKEALAAVGTSFPIIFALISFVIGIATGFTIIIAQFFGSKNNQMVIRTIDTMFIFLFFASIAVTILGLTLHKYIFRLIDLPEEVLPQAEAYLSIYLSGIVLFFGFNGFSAILRGLGDSKTPLYFMIISTIVNICLDLIFVIVFKWGIEGVAAATVIAQGGAFFTAILYLNRTHELINLSWRKIIFDPQVFRKSIQIGLPSGFQTTFVALGMIALYGIVNQFGTDTNAAFSVAARIDTFASMPAMNFAAALTTFVGQNIGARKPERVKSGLQATFYMTSTISLVVTIIVYLFSSSLMNLFTDDPEVIRIGRQYLIIVSSFYIVFSSMFIVGAVMRGAGDTLIPMFITLFSLWLIRIPVSYFLSRHIGVTGIWWGVPIAWMFGLTFSFIYYKSGRWKRKAVTVHERQESMKQLSD